MSKADYYDVLGVSAQADEDAIKSAYRKLAMRHHPDRNPGNAEAEKKFKEASEAYEVLRDPQKRRAYDRHGHAAFSQQPSGGGPGQGGGGGFSGFTGSFGGNFEDLFEHFFSGGATGGRGPGGGEKQSSPGRGADIRAQVELTLEEAFQGKKIRLKLKRRTPCETCNGAGGSGAEMCSACRGSGRIHIRQSIFTIQQTCGRCEGQGKTIARPCLSCQGQGVSLTSDALEVSVPPGVDSGLQLRVPGEGHAARGRSGQKGDLYVAIMVRKHAIFERDQAHLKCRVPVHLVDLVLGKACPIPTIEGRNTPLEIPAGTQSGTIFRLRKRGMPVLQSGGRRGDLLVEVQGETPQNITKKQRECLEAFQKEGDKKTGQTPKKERFYDKIKEYFDIYLGLC